MQAVTRANSGTTPRRALMALLAAAALARFAQSAANVAMVLFVVQQLHNAHLAGLLVSGLALPSVVMGPLLGVLLDRTAHKRAVFLIGEVVFVGGVLGVTVGAGEVPSPVLFAFATGAGLAVPLVTGGFSSLVPLVVPPSGLSHANTIDGATYNVAGIAGPGVVAVAVGAWGAHAGMLTTSAAGALALGLMVFAPMPATSLADGKSRLPLSVALQEGMRTMWRTPVLRRVTTATALNQVGEGLLPLALLLLAVALGVGSARGGWLVASLSLGALLGSVGTAWLLRRVGPERLLRGSLLLFAVLLAALAASPTMVVALALACLAGLVVGPALAATMNVRQGATPPQVYGQLVASAASVKVAAFAAGAAASGALAGALTARGLVLAVAGTQLLGALSLVGRSRGRR